MAIHWTDYQDALGILRKTKEEKELVKKQKLAMIKEMKKPNPPSSTKTVGASGSNSSLSKQVTLPGKSDRHLLPSINGLNGKKEEWGVAGGSSMPVSSSPSSSSSMLVHAATLGTIY